MKHPVRPAPAPPDVTGENYRMQRSATQVNKWEDFSTEDPFFMPESNRPKSVPPDRPAGKKKPPPRPPPPKFAQKPQSKPSSLLMNLFSRTPSTRQQQTTRQPLEPSSTKQPTRPHRRESVTPTTAIGSLINLNSPPSSPSPTSRSGSDSLSVNSFGSDGTASHASYNNHTTHFESGFEDNFDFFGGLDTNVAVNTPEFKDPWSVSSQDPFSPPRIQNPPKTIQKAMQVVPKPSVSVKPTIIRAKAIKPVRPPEANNVSSKSLFDEDCGDWSLPMPSVPPPPLPLEVLQELSPEVPPRPKQRQMETLKKPYGIALYDYAASHSDDLPFQANDVIFIERAVDSDWLFGELNGRRGIFPANFINVMVPLQTEQSQDTTVTSLYPFAAETWDDLEFPEGAVINVTSCVSSDWLYGEYGGKSGQFPAAFVDHIPSNLPQRKA